MKLYVERESEESVQTLGIAVIEAECDSEEGVANDEQLLDISNLSGNETYRDVKYNPLLTDKQKNKKKRLW